MAHADFIHLRVHTAYSLSEGAIRIGDLIAQCREWRMPAVAITDTGNLFGAMEFTAAATSAGVQPIIGCQVPIGHDDSQAKRGDGAAGPANIVILVQDESGYGNLLKLISRAYLDGDAGHSPSLSLDDFEGHSDGLIALTGGADGPVGRHLAHGQDDAARSVLSDLKRLFGDRLYMELQRHGAEIEERIEAALIDLAFAHDLPLVATNDAYFTTADMFEAHDALLCVAQSVTVNHQDRRRLSPEYRLKSPAEMRKLFADLPEAVDNTLVIARRCAFMPQSRKPILTAFHAESGRGEEDELRARAAAGLEARLASRLAAPNMTDDQREEIAAPYRARLAYELDVIVPMGFAGYFLIVADFIQWAKAQAIPVGPGRGSGAGSVVSWSLTITDLDPLRWGLLFERFLNPERVSMPDFDIDFCQDRRDEVIRYVQDKYGRDRVAQIITFGKLQARAVLRDVGRVLGMPYGQVDRISKLVPNNPANPVNLSDAIAGEPLLQQMRADEPEVARLIDIALKLEGLYRHASTHAAGVVIADRPLDELVPLYRDPRSDMPVTQFNMKYVELAGLVKFDFLGLKTLTILARAVELLRLRGIEVDLTQLPLDDAPTFALMARGDTTGVFQLESPGMRDLLRNFKPDRFQDIIAIVALYRPGPMGNIPSYTARKHGTEKAEYLHPSLEPVLRETFGIPIYQEQVMEMARVLAGYSLGGADLLRRAMGKKIHSEMVAQRRTFVDGSVANGVAEPVANRIFEQIEKFAGYGFPKAHAAAYALVAYQTAWFKATYPVELLAATMSLDIGNTDKLSMFKHELGRLGIAIQPPDINLSGADFTVESGEQGDTGDTAYGVRYALAAIKGVGRAAMEAVVAERSTNGPYTSLLDLAERVDARLINKRQLEQLVCAGALDSIDSNRARAFKAVDTLLRYAHATQADSINGQSSLFGASGAPQLRLPQVEDWEQAERLQRELEAIGFYMSAHPLDAYATALARLSVTASADVARTLEQTGTGKLVLAGVVLGRSERGTRTGTRMGFVQLSDATGAFEVVLFAEILGQVRDLLESGKALLIHTGARMDGEQARLHAMTVEPLEEACARTTAGLRIRLDDTASLRPLADLMQAKGRSANGAARGRVNLIVAMADEEVELALPGAYDCSPRLQTVINKLPGVVEVSEI